MDQYQCKRLLSFGRDSGIKLWGDWYMQHSFTAYSQPVMMCRPDSELDYGLEGLEVRDLDLEAKMALFRVLYLQHSRPPPPSFTHQPLDSSSGHHLSQQCMFCSVLHLSLNGTAITDSSKGSTQLDWYLYFQKTALDKVSKKAVQDLEEELLQCQIICCNAKIIPARIPVLKFVDNFSGWDPPKTSPK